MRPLPSAWVKVANGYPFGAIKRLEAHDEGIVSTLCLCFGVRNAEVLDSDFLVWLIEAGRLNRAICRIAHEGARSHGLLNVTASDFFGVKVSIPNFARAVRHSSYLERREGRDRSPAKPGRGFKNPKTRPHAKTALRRVARAQKSAIQRELCMKYASSPHPVYITSYNLCSIEFHGCTA